MRRIIQAIYSQIHKLLTGRPSQRDHVVAVTFSDGRSLEVPDMGNRLLYNRWEVQAVIPCKSVVVAVGEDKLLTLPVRNLGITARGDIQLMDVSCDRIEYAWHPVRHDDR